MINITNDCGVYVIENIVNGKKYVGQSAHMYRRWHQHRKTLQDKEHHNARLQHDWDEYGANAFCFYVLEFNENKATRDTLEKEYIKKFDSVENGYNMTYGGIFCRVTQEVKEKMSAAHKGYIKTEEHRKNLSLSLTGKSVSPESITKMKNTQVELGQSYVNDESLSRCIFDDYMSLTTQGIGKTDATKSVAQKYNVSTATVFRVRKKFGNTYC